MSPAALDPLALRVARRHLAAVQTSPSMLDRRASSERVAREYQRRGERLVPVDEEEVPP